jgi:MYXO-CTERM domain-containing protein
MERYLLLDCDVRSTLLVTACVVTGSSLLSSAAHACGGQAPAPAQAWPMTDTPLVSPTGSVIVASGEMRPEPHFEVLSNGSVLPTPSLTLLGDGFAIGGLARFWSLSGPLSPTTAYSIRQMAPGTAELSHFTTSASALQQPATPMTLDSLRLWHIRYDKSEVGAGGCVFSEYEGYVDADFTAATFADQAPQDLVNVLSLRAKGGGDEQVFVHAGPEFRWAFAQNGQTGTGKIPDGGRPNPQALWKPKLTAHDEYCLTVTSYGATSAPVTSNEICAAVLRIDARAAAQSQDDGCSYSGKSRTKAGATWLLGLSSLLALIALRRRRK